MMDILKNGQADGTIIHIICLAYNGFLRCRRMKFLTVLLLFLESTQNSGLPFSSLALFFLVVIVTVTSSVHSAAGTAAAA